MYLMLSNIQLKVMNYFKERSQNINKIKAKDEIKFADQFLITLYNQ